MDEDQAREIVDLIQGLEDGRGFLGHAGLRGLFFALDSGARGALDAVWIERLAALPPKTVDVVALLGDEATSGPVVPGTERFHTGVRLGAKLYGILDLRSRCFRYVRAGHPG